MTIVFSSVSGHLPGLYKMFYVVLSRERDDGLESQRDLCGSI